MSLHIIRPGLLATIQDLGRYHYQKYGVIAGGAMDKRAALAANCLVGNEEGEAVVELTLSGAELRVDQTAVIAICGADMLATIAGSPVPLRRPVLVRRGSIIKFSALIEGCRAYVAVGGGVDVPAWLGSRSTYVRGGMGGYEGRALRAGDQLAIKEAGPVTVRIAEQLSLSHSGSDASWSTVSWHASQADSFSSRGEEAVIRAMAGTHAGEFTAAARASFFNDSYRISAQSDRMGYRLDGGSELALTSPLELLSEGVAIGTVQVPPDGSPIVLMADRQTTGGYPRIAQVASVDISLLAQLKPGDWLRFKEITHAEAEQLYIGEEIAIQMLKAALLLKFKL